jgi:DNA (cytosine-5)-methyltransferase 1
VIRSKKKANMTGARIRTARSLSALTCIDLFAGAGGLSVGFHLAGFHSLLFNESDLQAANTFQENFPMATPFVCPIEKLTTRRIREEAELDGRDVDVVLGGPPCQGFSINAPIRSDKDPRNHLFRHYVRLVLEGLRPKFVVMENVPGLVSLDGGKTLDDVRLSFEKAGYRVAFKILNAAHYGVPQERWRLVFLGTRLPGVEPSLPEPVHYSNQRPNFAGGIEFTFRHAIGKREQSLFFDDALRPPTTVGDALSDLPPIPSGGGDPIMKSELPARSAYQELMRKGSSRLYNHQCADIASINMQRLRHVKPGGSWRDIPYELLPKGLQRARRSDHTKRYGRLDPTSLSSTILTKCDPHWGTFFHYEQDRVISVREAARLQSFPDTFHFMGSLGDQYKQVGNAVPPLLAKAIAEHIKELMDDSTSRKTKTGTKECQHATR